jgi:transcriptional regulator with XRE-family HTH domain
MKKIGEKLKKRREELGYTLRNMSEKTKVPIAKLQAIEDGDLKYFEDDFSYIKFYVRYYCNALLLDFETFKDELDGALERHFNTSQQLKTQEIANLQSRIQEKVQRSTPQRRKRFDVSFISFVVSMVLLSMTLILIFVFLILPNVQSSSNLILDETPMPRPPMVEEDEVVDERPSEPLILNVSRIQPLNYQISGFEEGQELTLNVNFRSNAYVRIKVDGDAAINIPSKLYNVGSVLDFKFNAEAGAVLEIYIGWMNGNTMFLDDIEIPIEDEFALRNGSVTLTFAMVSVQP